jgi:DNA-binding MarR family transcriptional regulator/N-acetylglutamate synthase-like GNAT family acetyltransferase
LTESKTLRYRELVGQQDSANAVATVREFNRFYTRVIGVLDECLLDTPYTLTEARVIFELAQGEQVEVVTLRRRLGLDPGYLSRILSRYESDGLIIRSRSTSDARRQVVRLTAAGRSAYKTLDERSARQIEAVLEGLAGEERRRLLDAMATIRDVLGDSRRQRRVMLRPLRIGDLGWVVGRHGVVYAEEYGWDQSFEALVARIVADYGQHHDSQRENAWIAEIDGEAVGCVFCVHKDDETAQLRILLVEPSARGFGVGTALVDACIEFARRAGYQKMVLWTNSVLEAARRIYERAGFKLLDEQPHHSYGHDLVSQWWVLDL